VNDFQPLPVNELKIAIDLIGKPYQKGGSSQKGFDCWGLVRYFYESIGHHIEVDYGYDVRSTAKDILKLTKQESQSPQWVKINQPENLCLVAMGRGEAITHVGIWIEGAVLHAIDKHGVLCQSPIIIKRQFNHNVSFYKWHKFT
jgi:cell wall-associated NlpC family hydrolase